MKACVHVKSFFECNDDVISITSRNEMEENVVDAMKRTGCIYNLIRFMEKQYDHRKVKEFIRNLGNDTFIRFGNLEEIVDFLLETYMVKHEDIIKYTLSEFEQIYSDEDNWEKALTVFGFALQGIIICMLQIMSHFTLCNAIPILEKMYFEE